ncbi:hypothetical protein JKP88DRAFT_247968 [Tribonema minus]|uniref:Uncharacterized protein n=1 Tax=Tribonema minus TaxID=303371 RepID=A0A835YSB4_9STRA|nr:hypothetical protein JKP88DRAFT_247968 [Tribonema minus]
MLLQTASAAADQRRAGHGGGGGNSGKRWGAGRKLQAHALPRRPVAAAYAAPLSMQPSTFVAQQGGAHSPFAGGGGGRMQYAQGRGGMQGPGRGGGGGRGGGRGGGAVAGQAQAQAGGGGGGAGAWAGNNTHGGRPMGYGGGGGAQGAMMAGFPDGSPFPPGFQCARTHCVWHAYHTWTVAQGEPVGGAVPQGGGRAAVQVPAL